MGGGGGRILLFDDDDCLRETLAAALRHEGFTVNAVATPAGVEEQVQEFHPDVGVFDVYLDGEPAGVDALRRVRHRTRMPVLFLSGSTELEDRLAGFAAGADDFLTKPFALPELLARLEVLLRRAGHERKQEWEIDDLWVDESAHIARRAGHVLELTNTEFNLLVAFLDHEGQVLTKPQLLSLVWGFDGFDVNLVEVHVSALRRKLEQYGSRLVHTVRGVGYVLRGEGD